MHSPRCGECRWPGLDARQGGGRGSIELGFIIIFFIVTIIAIITHQPCYEVVELLMDYHLLTTKQILENHREILLTPSLFTIPIHPAYSEKHVNPSALFSVFQPVTGQMQDWKQAQQFPHLDIRRNVQGV